MGNPSGSLFHLLAPTALTPTYTLKVQKTTADCVFVGRRCVRSYAHHSSARCCAQHKRNGLGCASNTDNATQPSTPLDALCTGAKHGDVRFGGLVFVRFLCFDRAQRHAELLGVYTPHREDSSDESAFATASVRVERCVPQGVSERSLCAARLLCAQHDAFERFFCAVQASSAWIDAGRTQSAALPHRSPALFGYGIAAAIPPPRWLPVFRNVPSPQQARVVERA